MSEELLTLDKLKKEKPVKYKIIQFNKQNITVKQYLPINKKLELISNVLEELITQSEYPFINPVHLEVYSTLEIIYAYTDIIFNKDELLQPAKLFDELEEQDLPNMIIAAIPETEYKFLMDGITETVNSYYHYRNSLRGILEDVSKDYKDLNFDAQQIQEKLADPENLTLLKDVLQKMG